MVSTFVSCTNLKSLDVSNLDTRKVTTMYSLFESCTSLEELDLSSFNTKNVTDFSQISYILLKFSMG